MATGGRALSFNVPSASRDKHAVQTRTGPVLLDRDLDIAVFPRHGAWTTDQARDAVTALVDEFDVLARARDLQLTRRFHVTDSIGCGAVAQFATRSRCPLIQNDTRGLYRCADAHPTRPLLALDPSDARAALPGLSPLYLSMSLGLTPNADRPAWRAIRRGASDHNLLIDVFVYTRPSPPHASLRVRLEQASWPFPADSALFSRHYWHHTRDALGDPDNLRMPAAWTELCPHHRTTPRFDDLCELMCDQDHTWCTVTPCTFPSVHC